MNIGSSKSIWGYGGRFHGVEGSFVILRELGSSMPGCCKRKIPDFRSPEVGISVICVMI